MPKFFNQGRLGCSRNGQAVLPLVFLMGGLVIIMSLTLIFLANAFLVSSYGFQTSERAEAVAASGAYDALLRLTRNIDLAASSPGYTLPLGSYSASVIVTQNSPASGQITITSSCTILGRTKKVVAIVSKSSLTGQTILASWQYIQ